MDKSPILRQRKVPVIKAELQNTDLWLLFGHISQHVLFSRCWIQVKSVRLLFWRGDSSVCVWRWSGIALPSSLPGAFCTTKEWEPVFPHVCEAFERLWLQARNRSERSGSCTVYHRLEVERSWPILGFLSWYPVSEPAFKYCRVLLDNAKGSHIIVCEFEGLNICIAKQLEGN